MMAVVRYFILSFKLSKTNIEIYYRFPMNSIYWLMEYRKVIVEQEEDFDFVRICLVNILELQKQPQEINRELKNAREEYAIAKEADEQIDGDRFADRIEVGRNC